MVSSTDIKSKLNLWDVQNKIYFNPLSANVELHMTVTSLVAVVAPRTGKKSLKMFCNVFERGKICHIKMVY